MRAPAEHGTEADRFPAPGKSQVSKVARALRPCGTASAYRRHLRHGERACDACLAAKRADWKPEYAAARRERRRAA